MVGVRVNEMTKRRIGVVSHFSKEVVPPRLVSALSIETSEDWKVKNAAMEHDFKP